MEEIELKDLFYMVWNKLWLIILLAVFFAAGSYYYTSNYITPQYQTSTTVMLGKPSSYNNDNGYSYQDVLINQRLIGTYAEIAKSKIVLSEVKENLGTDMSIGALSGRINVSLVGETEIIRISVRDTNPLRAMYIANATAEAFMNNVSQIMQIDNVQVIDLAEEPTYPISPSVTRNVGIAGVLGIMIALFIIFILQMFDNSIKIPEDIEKHLGLNVIGMIPKHD